MWKEATPAWCLDRKGMEKARTSTAAGDAPLCIGDIDPVVPCHPHSCPAAGFLPGYWGVRGWAASSVPMKALALSPGVGVGGKWTFVLVNCYFSSVLENLEFIPQLPPRAAVLTVTSLFQKPQEWVVFSLGVSLH